MQRLCVADFKHPCLKLWAFNFGHPCPSLVKGEVLSPEKNRATTGGIAFLPHPFRFSDTSVNNPSIVGSASHCNRSSPLYKGAKGDSALPTLPNPHYPTLSTTFLAPLPKGAGLRQGTNCRFVAFLLAIHPPFLFTKLFAVKTEGLLYAHQPLYPHNHCQRAIIPRPAPHSCHMNALLVSHHIASSAISAVASCNGFAWLTLSIHA